MTNTARRLTRNETGIRHLFGKRYIWLLDEGGALGLHKVDDKGDDESMKALLERQREQSE